VADMAAARSLPATHADPLEALLAAARQAALAGAEVARGWADRRVELDVSEKAAANDLVSQADHEAEAAIRAVVGRLRPDDAVLGEEAGATPGTTGIEWVVDPIDGTTNYLYGRADWAVSVAARRAEDGRALAGVVAEPALGRTTEARLGGGAWADGEQVHCRAVEGLERSLVEHNIGRGEQRMGAGRVVSALVPHVRDVRRGGSAAAALAQVATGRADAFWGPGLSAWDAAAGLLIVSEAGGAVGDLEGRTEASFPASGDVLACAPELWDPVRELLVQAYA